jgi:hypothetical protein
MPVCKKTQLNFPQKGRSLQLIAANGRSECLTMGTDCLPFPYPFIPPLLSLSRTSDVPHLPFVYPLGKKKVRFKHYWY